MSAFGGPFIARREGWNEPNLATRFHGSDAQMQALAKLTAMVRLQAAVMSYADVFLLLTVLFLVLAAFGLVMKRPQPQAGTAAGH